MKQIQVTQTSFDYLLMEIIRNRNENSETKEETKEKIKRIGYEVGKKLTETMKQYELFPNFKETLNFILNTSVCKPFFTEKVVTTTDNKKFIITVLSADFLSHLSPFGDSEELNQIKEFYVSFAIGILYGTIEIRDYRINIIQCLSKPNTNMIFELTLNVL